MAYAVYIIYSQSIDKYYVGYSENVDERLKQHNSGISDYSSAAVDWELKYTEYFTTRKEAIGREKEIKRKKSRKYVQWLISSFG